MKLDARRVESYLDTPGASRGALVYGDDSGLVRERVKRLIVSVAGALDDPFRVASIGRESLASLGAEISARCLTGGRRVVHLSDGLDGAVPWLRRALDGRAEGYLLVEAGGLPSKSKLRHLFETDAELASIPCYPPERTAMRAQFAQALGRFGVTAERDALDWAEQHLEQDRARVQADAERLALYVHPLTTASLSDLLVALADDAAASLDDLADAAFTGRLDDVERNLRMVFAAGIAPVALAVGILGHAARLHRCAALVQTGGSMNDVVRSIRPPIYARRQERVAAALGLWSSAGLGEAMALLGSAELACKQTGSPGELVVRNAVTRIALRAARSHGIRRSAMR